MNTYKINNGGFKQNLKSFVLLFFHFLLLNVVHQAWSFALLSHFQLEILQLLHDLCVVVWVLTYIIVIETSK